MKENFYFVQTLRILIFGLLYAPVEYRQTVSAGERGITPGVHKVSRIVMYVRVQIKGLRLLDTTSPGIFSKPATLS